MSRGKNVRALRLLAARLIVCGAALGLGAAVSRAATEPPEVLSPSGILVDAATGQVLWQHNPDERRPIASTTKIMTALLAIESGRLGETVTVSPEAAQVKESSLNLKAGEHLTLHDLCYGIMLRSANDACVAAAEHLSGSVPAFVDQMNSRAVELGCRNTHFVNPNGLHDPKHYSSARDLAQIARAAMADPTFRAIVATPTYLVARDRNRYDKRLRARDYTFLRTYPGANGIKTGHTKQAGRCFVGSARRGQLDLITVLLHSPNIGRETKALLDWGFRNFRGGEVARQGAPLGDVRVRGGGSGTVPVAAASAVAVVVPRAAPPVRVDLSGVSVEAPVKAGQRVGSAPVMSGASRVGTVDLVATRAVGYSPVRIIGRVLVGLILVGGVGVVVGAFAANSRRRRRRVAARGRGADPRRPRSRERQAGRTR